MAIITPLKKQREIYSDFHTDFTLSPVNFDLARKTNEESVKQSLKNLLTTSKGERLFQPNFGSSIIDMLFENFDPVTIETAKQELRAMIEYNEPRCNVIGLDIATGPDDNTAIVNIVFNVINRETPVTFNVTLTRIR